MMTGGAMMLGFGLLTMLIVLGLPILLIMGLVAVVWGLLGRRSGAVSAPAQAASAPAARYCSHCGYGLQEAWTHCPSCGEPIELISRSNRTASP